MTAIKERKMAKRCDFCGAPISFAASRYGGRLIPVDTKPVAFWPLVTGPITYVDKDGCNIPGVPVTEGAAKPVGAKRMRKGYPRHVCK